MPAIALSQMICYSGWQCCTHVVDFPYAMGPCIPSFDTRPGVVDL